MASKYVHVTLDVAVPVTAVGPFTIGGRHLAELLGGDLLMIDSKPMTEEYHSRQECPNNQPEIGTERHLKSVE